MRTLITAVATFALVGCGEPVKVSAHVTEACGQAQNQTVTEATGSLPSSTGSSALRAAEEVGVTQELDVPMQFSDEQRDTRAVTLDRVVISPEENSVSLDAVHEATLTLLPPDASSTLPTISLKRVPVPTKEGTLEFTGDGQDVNAYLKGRSLRYALALTGTPSVSSVVTTVESCASIVFQEEVTVRTPVQPILSGSAH